jgi:hypothetical protein
VMDALDRDLPALCLIVAGYRGADHDLGGS